MARRQCLRAIFPFANYLRTDLDRIGQKHMFIAVYFHTCMYTYYIFTWFGGRRHLWVVQAKLLAGSPTCLLLYVTACMHVHVFHQSCVYMHKLLRPVHKDLWPRSLATWIQFSLKKQFLSGDICISLCIAYVCMLVYVRRPMCILYVYVCKARNGSPFFEGFFFVFDFFVFVGLGCPHLAVAYIGIHTSGDSFSRSSSSFSSQRGSRQLSSSSDSPIEFAKQWGSSFIPNEERAFL